MLRLQTPQLSHKLPQLGGRLGLMPSLVIVVQASRRAVQDGAHHGKVLVAQLGEERVGRGEEVLLLFGRGAEGGG